MFVDAVADAIVTVHLAFIAFVLFGALLVLRWRWLAWLHLPAFTWGAAVQFLNGECPLTPLEQWLREFAGDNGYTGGFVEHYIVPVVYPAGLTRTIQLALGWFAVAINAAIYSYVLRQWPRVRRIV